MRDFMAAVCGPDAVSGACEKSVVQQLSTMPSWIYSGGWRPGPGEAPCDPATCLPAYPWNTTTNFAAYKRGSDGLDGGGSATLVDKTCGQMARYVARLVGHYTAGGHHDECGHFHPSGLNYSWYGLSVLNEDEHKLQPDDGTAYTKCYDAIMAEVHSVNPAIVGVGPEIAGTAGASVEYMLHFLRPKNHLGHKGVGAAVAPTVSSFHWGSSASAPPPNVTWVNEQHVPAAGPQGGERFLDDWERAIHDPNQTVQVVEEYKRRTGQKTEMVLNELISAVGDWCDPDDRRFGKSIRETMVCPSWQLPSTAGGDPDLRSGKGLGINRKTWSWNAAAALFAYVYGTLAELEYKYVGQDQLIGGTVSSELFRFVNRRVLFSPDSVARSAVIKNSGRTTSLRCPVSLRCCVL